MNPVELDANLLERLNEIQVIAQKLSYDIESAGQFVAAAAFDDCLYGIRKAKGVWNHQIKHIKSVIAPIEGEPVQP